MTDLDTMARSAAPAVDQLGCSDCEQIRPGFLRQPVNALSSLLYLVAAAGIVAEAETRPVAERTRMRRFAIAVAMNGIGSVAYHGPGGRGARWMHDFGVVASLLLMASADGAELGYELVPDWLALPVAAGFTAYGPVSEPAQLVAGVSFASAEVGRARAHRRRGLPGRRRRFGVPAVSLGVAGALHVLSRTGRPLCRPDSLLQGHAAWHAITAWAQWWWAHQRMATPD